MAWANGIPRRGRTTAGDNQEHTKNKNILVPLQAA
jgi:hypothetical protein